MSATTTKIVNNIVYIVVGILLAIVVMQNGCNNGASQDKSDTTRVVEHHWHEKEILPVHIKPTIFQTIQANPDSIPAEYQPSADCDTTKARYERLLGEHFAINSYQDTVHFDSLGYIVLSQDVYRNTLRPYTVKGKSKWLETKETVTITQPAKKKFQLYAGLDITGNQQSFLSGAQVGIIAKTKGDNIYRLSGGVINRHETFSFGVYWKIGKR